MIIKSMSRTTGKGNIGGLMNYMFREDKVMNLLKYQTREGKFKPCTIKHLLKGETLKEWAEEFEMNRLDRKFNRKGAVELYHEVISFARSDSHMIDDTMLTDITRRYISLRSPDAPVVATFHKDTEHVHVHLAIAGSKYLTGMANRMGKFEFGRIKRDMESYQRDTYPELNRSLVEHGRKAEMIRAKMKRRDAVRKDIQNMVSIVSSMEELRQLLEEKGASVYERGGKTSGITLNGRNFRFRSLGIEEDVRRMEKEEELLLELDDLRHGKEGKIREEETMLSTPVRLDSLERDFEERENPSEDEKETTEEHEATIVREDLNDSIGPPQRVIRRDDLEL